MASPEGSAQPTPVVAVLGAGGTMGRGMSINLAGAGIEVRAWNRTAEKLDDLAGADGVRRCATPVEAAAGADVVLTILSDGDAVLTAVDGPEGALASAGPETIWLQASTIGIAAAEHCAELARERRVGFVDAPVLGTKQPAEEGQLVILASGPESARPRLEPVFEAIGKRTLWVGEAGAGSRLKVVVNSWIVSVVEATAELVALAEGLGVDPAQALDAVSGGPLDLPYMRIKSQAMLAREFPPSFRLALAAKDARLAVEAAEEADLKLPMLAAVARTMADAAREHGDEDLAAVYLAVAPST